jgi:hypothetical protein
MTPTATGQIEDATLRSKQATALQEGNFPARIPLTASSSTQEMATKVCLLPGQDANVDKRARPPGARRERF